MLKAINFDTVFISWILLLHDGAKTKLLLDPLSVSIDILFSVRQGDPLSMILFVIYIEPLLLCLHRNLEGFSLRSHVLGQPADVLLEGASEDLEAYVDDSEAIVTSDEELLLLDAIVRD